MSRSARLPQAEKGWHVYIVRCRDGTLYTGIAIDVSKRLEAHRSGVGAKYTRSRLPISLVYEEHQPDRSSALRREAALRLMGREAKLALICPHPRSSPMGGPFESV